MAAMGQTKSGIKSNLLVRAVGVIQTQCNSHLLTVLRQLYQERYAYQTVPGNSQRTPGSHQEEQTVAPVMVPLPFYQTLGTILPPTQLMGFFSDMQNQEFIRLTPKQVEQNRNCKELRPGVPSVQVVLRFCFTESLGYEEDQYPPCLWIRCVTSQFLIDGLLTVILVLEGFQDNTEVEYLADGSWGFVIDGVRRTQSSALLEKMEVYSGSSVTATTSAVSTEVATVDLTQDSSEDEADEVTKP
ncbi:unnamed protein product [Coregonus sp. 'balchen']|nr:unnamed protein product [Coregonus sp. 'balchen']